MNIFIFIGQALQGVLDADTLSEAMSMCHDFKEGNLFRIVGGNTDLTGTPKVNGSISWRKTKN